MQSLSCKGLRIGEGIPKIVVPIMGATVEQSVAAAKDAIAAGADIIEWRADFAASAMDAAALVHDAREIASTCANTPLLFTMRTAGEGGCAKLSGEEYSVLIAALIHSGCIDLVDIEQQIGEFAVRDLIAAAQDQGVATIVSSHDFQKTPSQEAMAETISRMHEWGADIAKLAVMAHSMADALRVMAVTNRLQQVYPSWLVAAMAMGPAGSITRLTGERYGSVLAFCSLYEESAPGQVEVMRAKRIMSALHDSIVRDQ